MQGQQEQPDDGKRVILRWLTKERSTPSIIPDVMRLVMTFIDRVGFPILAFLIMTTFLGYVVYKMTPVLESMTKTLEKLELLMEILIKK
jgi:hypothetical protein